MSFQLEIVTGNPLINKQLDLFVNKISEGKKCVERYQHLHEMLQNCTYIYIYMYSFRLIGALFLLPPSCMCLDPWVCGFRHVILFC